MKTSFVLLAVAAMTFGSGCAIATGGNASTFGGLYTDYKSPGAVGTGTGGSKTGEACASSILGIIGTGDASIAAAKQAGGIGTVAHVDHEIFGVLGIYAKTCTTVHGD